MCGDGDRKGNPMLKQHTSAEKKLRFAIDLTWVRHGIVGGTESFVCNLMEGFQECLIKDPGKTEILMLASKDNYDVFRKYASPRCIKILKCNVLSADQKKRLLWQNLKMGKMLKKLDVSLLLEPVYSKPFLGMDGICCVTVIHDLQAWLFPEYFSKKRVAWMKCCWRNSVRTSAKLVAISDYTKQSILERIPCPKDRICVIYNPIVMNNHVSEEGVLKQYGMKTKQYYYTVSSQVPHKNLGTLLRAMGILKKKHSPAMLPLILSGVGNGVTGELQQILKEEMLEDDVIFTGFIADEVRNTLYRNSKAFLFPSIFEGFGMPPLEAMALQVPVLTTQCASIREVTGGLVNYIKEPKDPEEWAERLEQELKIPEERDAEELLDRYDKCRIAAQYLVLMEQTAAES